MIKGLKDDKIAFAVISLISIAIAMLALAANSVFVQYGGYAAGAAFSGILFAALCFVYNQTSDEMKKRTRDMFFGSIFIITMYFIFTLLVDISQLALRTFAGITDMGITVLVFIGLFWAIGIWEIIRLILEIFGIKLSKYEDLLAGRISFKKKQVIEPIQPEAEIPSDTPDNQA